MSGLDAVIARVGDIESRIVSLDTTSRAARVAEAAAPSGAEATGASSASTFAGVLDAVQATAGSGAASDPASGSPATVVGATSEATGAELVAALQTLFSASTGGAGSAGLTDSTDLGTTLQKLTGLLG